MPGQPDLDRTAGPGPPDRHALQESAFITTATSRTGAKGLMQLMPGTARETSGKISMAYRPDALTVDTDYNIALGATYIERMLDYYGGN